MNAKELSQRMAGEAAAIAQYLFPNGKRSAGEWRVGGTSGEPGQSLGIRLTGAKAGVWADFASGEKGDLLDAWAAVRGCSIAEAIREGLIRRIHIYGSRQDGALRFAQATRPLLGWLGLGYGSLGLRGREFAALFPEVAQDHSDDSCGHSTWLQRGPQFESLMQAISQHELADHRIPLSTITHGEEWRPGERGGNDEPSEANRSEANQ